MPAIDCRYRWNRSHGFLTSALSAAHPAGRSAKFRMDASSSTTRFNATVVASSSETSPPSRNCQSPSSSWTTYRIGREPFVIRFKVITDVFSASENGQSIVVGFATSWLVVAFEAASSRGDGGDSSTLQPAANVAAERSKQLSCFMMVDRNSQNPCFTNIFTPTSKGHDTDGKPTSPRQCHRRFAR